MAMEPLYLFLIEKICHEKHNAGADPEVHVPVSLDSYKIHFVDQEDWIAKCHYTVDTKEGGFTVVYRQEYEKEKVYLERDLKLKEIGIL